MTESTPKSSDHEEAEATRRKAEGSRQKAEQDRRRAEGDRQAAEDARTTAERERAAVLGSVTDVADTLQATLKQMKVVEDLRRLQARQES